MRVAILSFAHMHAWAYAHALQVLPDPSLAVIWDEDPQRGKQAADRFGCPFEPNLEAVLASDIGAVIITAANAHHKDLAVRAARAGKHILCEKPIATSVADAEAMIAAARDAGVQLMTAFPVRYAPSVLRVKRALDNGEIGQVLAVKATNHGRMPGGWFINKELAGGGAVLDHTVHVADLLRWMLGREFKTVYAEIGTRFHEVEIDDCGLLTMEMDGGVIVTQDPSWSRIDAYPIWGDVTMEIVGTAGSISLDVFSQNISVYNNKDTTLTWAGYGSDTDAGMVADFVRCAATGEPVPITGEDGLRAMEVALMAYESARRGETLARG